MERELGVKADLIQQSGDWNVTNALNRGKNGAGYFYPNAKASIEAYRTGLNLFFQSSGLKDYIAAEEVVTGDISLQQGFFDRFRIEPPIFLSKNSAQTREFSLTAYQEALRQFQSLQIAGIDVGYSSYLKGALIAIRVEDAFLKETIEKLSDIVNFPTDSDDNDRENPPNTVNDRPGETMVGLNYDRIRKEMEDAKAYLEAKSQEREILEMALKDPTSPIDLSFTPEEIKRLEFLKRLKKEGRI